MYEKYLRKTSYFKNIFIKNGNNHIYMKIKEHQLKNK